MDYNPFYFTMWCISVCNRIMNEKNVGWDLISSIRVSLVDEKWQKVEKKKEELMMLAEM